MSASVEPELGIRHHHCDSFANFMLLIDNEFKGSNALLWRGHAKEEWLLESTLERRVRDTYMWQHGEEWRLRELPAESVRKYGAKVFYSIDHALHRFPDLTDPQSDVDYTKWCLGRHHGLLTPLVDWTKSPYAAAFFAFVEINPRDLTRLDGNVALWGLYVDDLKRVVDERCLVDGDCFFGLIEDLSSANRRMFAQQGMFTYTDPPKDMVSLVQSVSKEIGPDALFLEKITLPRAVAKDAILHLLRMNVSFITLYPDFEGACLNANLSAQSADYLGYNYKGDADPAFQFMQRERSQLYQTRTPQEELEYEYDESSPMAEHKRTTHEGHDEHSPFVHVNIKQSNLTPSGSMKNHQPPSSGGKFAAYDKPRPGMPTLTTPVDSCSWDAETHAELAAAHVEAYSGKKPRRLTESQPHFVFLSQRCDCKSIRPLSTGFPFHLIICRASRHSMQASHLKDTTSWPWSLQGHSDEGDKLRNAETPVDSNPSL